MLDQQGFEEILQRIELKSPEYKTWYFRVGRKDSAYWMQVCFSGADHFTGKLAIQYGRKWMLSEHMVPTEVVRTAHMAFRQAVLHEADEVFSYLGSRIYSPHLSIAALVEAGRHVEVR